MKPPKIWLIPSGILFTLAGITFACWRGDAAVMLFLLGLLCADRAGVFDDRTQAR